MFCYNTDNRIVFPGNGFFLASSDLQCSKKCTTFNYFTFVYERTKNFTVKVRMNSTENAFRKFVGFLNMTNWMNVVVDVRLWEDHKSNDISGNRPITLPTLMNKIA